MPLQPTTLLIPEAIDKGLKSGELTRDGSIVRNTAGQIVKHLVEVPTTSNAEEKALELVRAAAGRHPVVVGAIGLIALTALGASVTVAMSKKDAEEAKSQKRVDAEARFKTAAAAWLNANYAGELTTGTVSELQEALHEYDASCTEWGAQPAELAVSLMHQVKRYNVQNGLAKSPPPAPDAFTDDIVVDLSQHLAAQRERLRKTT